jgi:transaldolase
VKFFIDTADVAEIKELASTGLLDGVTTNPSLVAKAKRDFKEIIAEICAIVAVRSPRLPRTWRSRCR